ncbi:MULTISPECIES: Shedu immune nuclease family protein [Flavobacteriaceae]|uniref:Shedu protein SduA C-terminal domain-containing protein n=1 Tax=Leeuwenhoekiella blandensis (strain CECT 7118 / CCUG 51940 / KCTC 22103 / MED217) TaxID=398720 RepID=A3XIZ7_LEEBM|nr:MULTISPECIES: Shedu immune nuclease family protein [Flavobacteriaceae]EAQ50476.1 hypothetical protein MED217_05572 [Leeuwenhoekiella blandensis MED217]
MVEIEKIDSKLVLKYYSDYEPTEWLDKKLETLIPFKIKHIFNVGSKSLLKKIENEFQESEYFFEIGELMDGYYGVYREVLGVSNTFFFHKSLDIKLDYFFVKSKSSLLLQIDKHLQEDIYIGGPKETILPIEEFEKLIKIFPTTHEITLYRQAKVTSVLKNYFDYITDKEESYQNYLNNKTPNYGSNLRKTFREADIVKYQTLLEKLKEMLSNEVKYTEHQWQAEIIEIILLLFPKYIAVFDEVKFKDIYNNKTRRLDYGLIDFMGNLDIVEIKIPFDKNIVSANPYRDNHIPNKDLSGTIMQIEKYIFYLNKTGANGEKRLTEKYKDQLPEKLKIKITNPNGMIIMGRDNNLTESQLSDFEIIKRKYKNIIDIFTYDDLMRRMEIMLAQLERI